MEIEILKVVPAPVRRAVRAVLPAATVDRMRRRVFEFLYERGRVQHDFKWVQSAKRTLGIKPTLYHLETKITEHCNLRCMGCTNFSNISKSHNVDIADYTRDLARLSELIKVSHFYIMGGEPLLHPEVGKFALATRKYFPSSKVYVFTNTILVPKVSEEAWAEFRQANIILLCDDYPIDIDKEAIDAIAHGHGIKTTWTPHRTEFFRIPIDLDGSYDAAEMHAACKNVDSCPNLRDGVLYLCGRVAVMEPFREHYGVDDRLKAGPKDSLSIYGDLKPWDVMDFMMNPIPWCAHCAYDKMYTFPWQRGADTLAQWTGEDVPDVAVPCGPLAETQCSADAGDGADVAK